MERILMPNAVVDFVGNARIAFVLSRSHVST